MQLRDDLLSMLVAGHETTGSVLTWTLYLLSKVPFGIFYFAMLQNLLGGELLCSHLPLQILYVRRTHLHWQKHKKK